tara:strand:+ start:734 stop:976 length:243 start_codon:yes stop_codon:yes gene_type:complete
MKISNGSFGGRTKFSVGDVVSWTFIGKRLTGVISSLKESMTGGRKVIYAHIFCFEDKQNCEVLTLNLKTLSKSDSNQQEN